MTDLLDIHQELNVHVHSQGENVDRIGIIIIYMIIFYWQSVVINYYYFVQNCKLKKLPTEF